MFIAGYKYTEHNQLGPVYGLITPALTRLLKTQHIPISATASERYIQSINATKQPVILNLPVLKRLIGSAGDMGIDVSNNNFSYLNINK